MYNTYYYLFCIIRYFLLSNPDLNHLSQSLRCLPLQPTDHPCSPSGEGPEFKWERENTALVRNTPESGVPAAGLAADKSVDRRSRWCAFDTDARLLSPTPGCGHRHRRTTVDRCSEKGVKAQLRHAPRRASPNQKQ